MLGISVQFLQPLESTSDTSGDDDYDEEDD